MDNKVLAVVDGEEITQEEFNWFLKTIPSDRQAYLNNPQFREQCLQQLISLHLFAKLGEQQELNQTKEYEEILLNAKRDILAQMAMTQMMKDVDVTDDEVEKFYNENQKNFEQGASVNAKHILVDSEDKCKELLELLQAGEKEFEVAAQEFSTCPSGKNGGQLGEFRRGQMVKEFEDAAFAAEIGTIVGPVKTQFGYHLIKVESKKEATTIPFADVKENIKKSLLQKAQNQAYNDKIKELKKVFKTEIMTDKATN